MSLTVEDLGNIEALMRKVSAETERKIDGRLEQFDGRFDQLDSRLDRMEARILFSLDIWQRDGSDTLADHELRLKKLEGLAAL